MLLDDIGPSILVTDGDGAVFAAVTAEERPALVKAIVSVDRPATRRNVAFRGIPTTTAAAGATRNHLRCSLVLAWLDRTIPRVRPLSASPIPIPIANRPR